MHQAVNSISILDAMMRPRDESGISFLYITHDLSTAYQICDEFDVLYQGLVAETGRRPALWVRTATALPVFYTLQTPCKSCQCRECPATLTRFKQPADQDVPVSACD